MTLFTRLTPAKLLIITFTILGSVVHGESGFASFRDEVKTGTGMAMRAGYWAQPLTEEPSADLCEGTVVALTNGMPAELGCLLNLEVVLPEVKLVQENQEKVTDPQLESPPQPSVTPGPSPSSLPSPTLVPSPSPELPPATESAQPIDPEATMVELIQSEPFNVQMTLKNVDTYERATYLITYHHTTHGVDQTEAISGEVEITKSTITKGHIYLATCSSGGLCIPHLGVTQIEIAVVLQAEDGLEITTTVPLTGEWTE